MIQNFFTEVKKISNEISAYYKQNKTIHLFTVIWLLFLYGMRLVHWDIFVDSDIMLATPEELMFSWYGHRRFGLILTKRLFSFVRLNPYIENILLLLVMWLIVFLIGFSFYVWSGKKKVYSRAIPLFILVFPSAACFAEQFGFTLQSFESALAMLFCVIAAICAEQTIQEKKNILWLIPAMGFMIWAFGSYQAYPAFFIALVIMAFVIVYMRNEEKSGFKEAVCYLILFLVSFALTQIFATVICKLEGGDSSYVNAMFSWGNQSVSVCLDNIKSDFIRIYGGEWALFFSPHFKWCVLFGTLLLITYCWRLKSKKFIWLFFSLLVLAVTPILITILTANLQPIRAQMTYPLVYAFYIMICYVIFYKFAGELQGTVKKLMKAGCLCVCLVCVILGWKQGVNMNQLWETAHEVYQSDTLTANRMYEDICEVADRTDMENCKVAFVGTRPASLAGNPLRGDVIGFSSFQWDSGSAIGVSGRVKTFFSILGLTVNAPSAEEYQEALIESKNHPSWPANDSVFMVGECVVVKLSEVE